MNYKDFIKHFDLNLNARTVTIVLSEDQLEQLSDSLAHIAGLLQHLPVGEVHRGNIGKLNTYSGFATALLTCRTAFDALAAIKPKSQPKGPLASDTIEGAMAEIEAKLKKGGLGSEN